MLPWPCPPQSNLCPGQKGDLADRPLSACLQMQEVGAPPRTEQDAPPLRCWHTRKSGMPELSPSLRVSITPAVSASLTNTSASQVCQPPDLYLLLLPWEIPFLCFILQREEKRKDRGRRDKALAALGCCPGTARSVMGSPPSSKHSHFIQTYKTTLAAPWFSQPCTLGAC